MRNRLGWLGFVVVVFVTSYFLVDAVFRAWPDLRRVAPYLTPIWLLVLTVITFRPRKASDRPFTLAVVIPVLGLGIASIAAPWPWGALLALAALALIFVIAFSEAARWWWWVHVLRHPRPRPEGLFVRRLYDDVVEWSELLARDKGDLRPKTRHDAAKLIARMRGREAPNDELADLRDDYASLAERWTATPRDDTEAQAYADMRDQLGRLHDRLRESLERLRDESSAVESADADQSA